MPIRLLIADSHEIIRTGVSSMLAGTDIEIVGEASDSKETLRQAAKLKPDVVLLDIQMPDGFALLNSKKVPDEDVLTPRQSQLLRHVALGLNNKEIARAMDISIETVKEHMQCLMRGLCVADRTKAAVWAVQKGMV